MLHLFVFLVFADALCDLQHHTLMMFYFVISIETFSLFVI